MRAPTAVTLREAAEDWLRAAEAGIIRTRSGDPYKPSALRSYREAIHSKLPPHLAAQRLSAASSNQIQDLVDRLVAQGLAASTVRNAILPLRAIYRRALQRNEVAVNPTLKLCLPAVRGRRDQIADPGQAAALIAALPVSEQALWATALYTGLRRGELQALTWNEIDLEHNLIHVNHAWDKRAGLISPKSRSGRRRIPLTSTLRRHLIAHRIRQDASVDAGHSRQATVRITAWQRCLTEDSPRLSPADRRERSQSTATSLGVLPQRDVLLPPQAMDAAAAESSGLLHQRLLAEAEQILERWDAEVVAPDAHHDGLRTLLVEARTLAPAGLARIGALMEGPGGDLLHGGPLDGQIIELTAAPHLPEAVEPSGTQWITQVVAETAWLSGWNRRFDGLIQLLARVQFTAAEIAPVPQ